MTTTTFVIVLLSILAGYISNAVQSGGFLGIATVPKAWLPYLTLLGTFLASFAQAASSSTPPDWKGAVLAGLLALGGTTVGITAHQHVVLGKKASAKPEAPEGTSADKKAA